MSMRHRASTLLVLSLLGGVASWIAPGHRATRRPCVAPRHPISRPRRPASPATRLFLFDFGAAARARIPASPSDRDRAAIAAVKAAIQKPRNPDCPLIECEFPALAALNKLGDGSLRSSLEAEDANVAFVGKLVGGIATPFFGPGANVWTSSSAPKSLVDKVRKTAKGAAVLSAKDGVPQQVKGVSVFLTPSSKKDYQTARSLAESGHCTVLVNGAFKDLKSVSGAATMAYFLKPLTYNSQIAGFLIRSYPSSWTVLDAQTKAVLGSFADEQILVDGTNTPDLRQSGRLVQKSVDERAIKARAKA